LEHDNDRISVFLVDDDGPTLDGVRDELKNYPFPGMHIEAIEIGSAVADRDLEEATVQARYVGEDPSIHIGRVVFDHVAQRLRSVNSENRWLVDGCRFVVVSDIVLHRDGASAGLEVIHRIRDAFPFVTTIALTVRRWLAYELQDEGADGYVVKDDDNIQSTAQRLGEVIRRLVWESETAYFHPGASGFADDAQLMTLMGPRGDARQAKYFLKRVERIDASVRFACFSQNTSESDRLEMRLQLPPRAVIGVVLERNASSADMWEVLRNWRDDPDRRVVLLRESARDISGSGPTRLCPSSILLLDKALRPEPPKIFNRRWTLLVPRSAHYGTLNFAVKDKELGRYRATILEKFGGATTSDAAGVWLGSSSGREIQDDSQKIEVLGRGTERARQFLRDLGDIIIDDLGQEEVFLQEDKVSVWSLKQMQLVTLPEASLDDGRLTLEFAEIAAAAAGIQGGGGDETVSGVITSKYEESRHAEH
jgi:hypothetical protein